MMYYLSMNKINYRVKLKEDI